MKGHFYSASFVAVCVLIVCATSTVVVCTNAKVMFSFQIIALVALSCLGTLVFQFVHRRGQQTCIEAAVFGLAIFAMQLFVPISIFFTQRQWTLLKRHQIKNCEDTGEIRNLFKELSMVKWGFGVLLYSSLLCMVLYSAATAIYSHYAIHVAPCNEDFHRCPPLVWLGNVIRILQVCIYLAYTICAGLMCLFSYRMH